MTKYDKSLDRLLENCLSDIARESPKFRQFVIDEMEKIADTYDLDNLIERDLEDIEWFDEMYSFLFSDVRPGTFNEFNPTKFRINYSNIIYGTTGEVDPFHGYSYYFHHDEDVRGEAMTAMAEFLSVIMKERYEMATMMKHP